MARSTASIANEWRALGAQRSDKDAFVRMLAGMDQPSTGYDTPALQGTTAKDGPTPRYNTDPKDAAIYKAQQNWRGIGEAALGVGDVTNDYLNAGIRDIGWLVGNNEPYQFPRPSEAAANLAADWTNTPDIDTSKLPPSVQREAANSRAMYGMIPTDVTDVASLGVTGAAKLGASFPLFTRRGFGQIGEDVADVEDAAKTWWSPISKTKLTKPVEDMTATYSEPRTTMKQERILTADDLGELEEATVLPLVGDITMAGRRLTGLGDQSLDVDLLGGYDFMRDSPDVWAADQGAITKLDRRVQDAAQNGKPVIGMFHNMSGESGDFSQMNMEATLQRLMQSELGGSAVSAIDLAMSQPFGKAGSGGKPAYTATPNWPGIMRVQSGDDYLAELGGHRAKLAKIMAQPKIQALGGVPSTQETRWATADPTLLKTPPMHGFSLARLDTGGVNSQPAKGRYDYNTNYGGDYIGRFDEPVPAEYTLPDWWQQKTGGNPPTNTSQLQRGLSMADIRQSYTPKVIDRLAAYLKGRR